MKPDPNTLGDSFRFLQKIVREAGPAASASYTLLAAVLLLGGIGYVLDRHYETAPVLLLIGILLGLVVGFYELAKTIFRKP
ncbi:MAG: hypothetical protein D6762_03870 [Candidatus Neomarinimicrobiota bacterium]|nr:MAG: hypothetical protein D6762_03870 [Candidatus Neomarinimicrobiota bacterium]